MDANQVAIQRYERAHERMQKTGQAIPPVLLTRYINAMRAISRERTGFNYAKTLIVTGSFSATPKVFQELFQTAIDNGWEIIAR